MRCVCAIILLLSFASEVASAQQLPDSVGGEPQVIFMRNHHVSYWKHYEVIYDSARTDTVVEREFRFYLLPDSSIREVTYYSGSPESYLLYDKYNRFLKDSSSSELWTSKILFDSTRRTWFTIDTTIYWRSGLAPDTTVNKKASYRLKQDSTVAYLGGDSIVIMYDSVKRVKIESHFRYGGPQRPMDIFQRDYSDSPRVLTDKIVERFDQYGRLVSKELSTLPRQMFGDPPSKREYYYTLHDYSVPHHERIVDFKLAENGDTLPGNQRDYDSLTRCAKSDSWNRFKPDPRDSGWNINSPSTTCFDTSGRVISSESNGIYTTYEYIESADHTLSEVWEYENGKLRRLEVDKYEYNLY